MANPRNQQDRERFLELSPLQIGPSQWWALSKPGRVKRLKGFSSARRASSTLPCPVDNLETSEKIKEANIVLIKGNKNTSARPETNTGLRN